MFKSLSSRSTRSVSVSSSNSLASTSASTTTPTSAAFIPTVLPPIPPTPTRDTPTICVVAPTPGGPTSSPLLEKRRTRTLVPRRTVLGKENGQSDGTPRAGSLRTRPVRPAPAPPLDEPMDPATLVARQFVASHNERHRQFHSVGPTSGISFVPAPRNPSPPSRPGSFRIKPGKINKRVLVETRVYPNGGQVEVVKETVGRSSKPLARIGSEVLGSLRGGTITSGSTRLSRNASTKILGDSVRENLAEENGGTSLVVKKKKSRATLDSIRWALGDRTNVARKAEKEKERTEKAANKERRSQDSGADRPKAKLTIDTRLPPAPVDETPTTSTILSPVVDTPATTVGDVTDGEGIPQSASGEKSKWRWTIGRKRTKSPGPSLSSTSGRPAHSRANSLDLEALLAATHPEESETPAELYSNPGARPASADLPTLMRNATTDAQTIDAPLHRPFAVETAPVDFGNEPKTIRKTSTGSAETQNSSGTTRRTSIGNIFTSSGDNASNTGSFAVRAMRSVRSIASLARIGGWNKGEDEDKDEKEGTLKVKKNKYRKKVPIMEDEQPHNIDDNEPTTRVQHAGQPTLPDLQRGDASFGEEGPSRISEDRQSSGSSCATPSTISYGRAPHSRMSNASSGSSEYAASSSTNRSRSSRAPSMRIHARHSAPIDDGGLFSEDGGSPVGAGMSTAKGMPGQAVTSRRAPKGLMGLFDPPPPAPPPTAPSPPHLEVRGVKVHKGSVRARVQQFEARAEEHSTASQFGSIRSGSVPRRAPSLGFIAALAAQGQESFAEERSYALSMGRSSSVPLLSSESPHRPTPSRPLSEQLLRPRDPAALSILNAANSDLSDLISSLDLFASPDSQRHLSPDPSRRFPTWVDDSPIKRPAGREPKSSITSIKGYDHSSLRPQSTISSSSMTEEEDSQLEFRSAVEMKINGTAKASLVVLPAAASVRSQRPRSRISRGSISASTRLSVASTLDTVCESPARIQMATRHHVGLQGALAEDAMLVGTAANSDIPDELQVILAGQSEDEGLMPSPDFLSPPLPTHGRHTIQNHSRVHFDADSSDEAEGAGSEGEEASTRRSFDFTGELGQLKGGSRNSFVEALVTAFSAPPIPGVSEGQLQLSFDSTAEGSSMTYAENDVAPDEMVDSYDAGGRTPTFARAPVNKKLNGRLNLEFSFSDPQPSTSQPGPSARPVPSHGRQVTFEVEVEQPSTTRNALPPVASDPFGAHQSQSWIQSDDTTRSLEKARLESMASIPSMSSLGQVLHVDQDDTFDYDNLMRELDAVSSSINSSTQALERSAARRRHHRLSTDSDRSSLRGRRNSRREDTLMSFAFGAPPVSFHNRPYGRQLGHNQNMSIEQSEDMVREDTGRFSVRPGLGDKMFQTGAEHGMPLPSIIASPANSDASEQQETFGDYANRRFSYVSDRRHSYISERGNPYAPSITDQHRMSFVSYDSRLDVPRDSRRTSFDGESMYERRGRPSSVGSISIFGDDKRRRRRSRAVHNPTHFRPVSIISMQSETTAEDDTMVSMIGGGDNSRVPRKSIGTNLLFDTSPCMRAEKRARDLSSAQFIEANRAASLSALTGQPIRAALQHGSSRESILEYSPSKGRSCVPFSRPRAPGPSKQADEDSDMDELDVTSDQTPMLSMPNRSFMSSRNSLTGDHTSNSRKRSSLICTAEPPDTPPLSDTGSDGSQSSIDVSKLSGMINSASVPPSSGRRARARGLGHRRPSSHSSLTSRSSASIAESDLPRGAAYLNRSNSGIRSSDSDSVVIVNPDVQMAEMIEMISAGYPFSDDQMTLVTRYCALRNEAMETVARSQQIWQDTDFSRFALSTFAPPTHPAEIKAMIDHSQDVYNELPAELYKRARPRHSRNFPRSSPYPADVSRRSIQSGISPRARLATESVENVLSLLPPMYDPISHSPRPVYDSPVVSRKVLVNQVPPSPALVLSPLTVNYRPSQIVEQKSSKHGLRQRAALGWGRKKAAEEPPANSVKGKGKAVQSVAPTAAKENEGAGLMSASNNSLRLNRPRPKGRVASASSRPTTLRV